ncbi:hypothetical protein KTE60_05215 [Burkholderia multivorans]|uniref:hypothetical protein n=1 Tax=Burkholderia multivorans TaxID=87883 RepID=UPI0015E3CE8A|nr:hypothetical protein [Burkholderia multivorans]MBU9519763.1 hypothetical protein [Burkholderia multivorans]MBU9628685.1 hypothetical protein [Burkholderia multivorans]MBU9647978.1 hypothetical protein [Burkholderia multivorans]MBU9678995.1 hypothetical protein [Burkholderia multivorans]MCA8247740.1 hypothetical protein [Burkholderia multivorans]
MPSIERRIADEVDCIQQKQAINANLRLAVPCFNRQPFTVPAVGRRKLTAW